MCKLKILSIMQFIMQFHPGRSYNVKKFVNSIHVLLNVGGLSWHSSFLKHPRTLCIDISDKS